MRPARGRACRRDCTVPGSKRLSCAQQNTDPNMITCRRAPVDLGTLPLWSWMTTLATMTGRLRTTPGTRLDAAAPPRALLGLAPRLWHVEFVGGLGAAHAVNGVRGATLTAALHAFLAVRCCIVTASSVSCLKLVCMSKRPLGDGQQPGAPVKPQRGGSRRPARAPSRPI